MKQVSRRRFLALATTAAVTAARGKPAELPPTQPAPAKPLENADRAAAVALPSSSMSAIDSEEFVPDIVLDCAFLNKTIDGHKVRLRAYSGTVPGPMIETTAGRTLNIRVTNSLTPDPDPTWNRDMDVPHELDHTNLHLHGWTSRRTSSSRWARPTSQRRWSPSHRASTRTTRLSFRPTSRLD